MLRIQLCNAKGISLFTVEAETPKRDMEIPFRDFCARTLEPAMAFITNAFDDLDEDQKAAVFATRNWEDRPLTKAAGAVHVTSTVIRKAQPATVRQESQGEKMGKGALAMAHEIAEFAKKLSEDQELLSEALYIARHSISSDFLASRRRSLSKDSVANPAPVQQ